MSTYQARSRRTLRCRCFDIFITASFPRPGKYVCVGLPENNVDGILWEQVTDLASARIVKVPSTTGDVLSFADTTIALASWLGLGHVLGGGGRERVGVSGRYRRCCPVNGGLGGGRSSRKISITRSIHAYYDDTGSIVLKLG